MGDGIQKAKRLHAQEVKERTQSADSDLEFHYPTSICHTTAKDPNGYWWLQQRIRLDPSMRGYQDLGLCAAAASGDVDRVKHLLVSGIEPNTFDHPNRSMPLILGMVYSSTCNPLRGDLRGIARLLLSHRGDASLKDSTGSTALMHASLDLLEEVHILLRDDIDVNDSTEVTRLTALHLACDGYTSVPPVLWYGYGRYPAE